MPRVLINLVFDKRLLAGQDGGDNPSIERLPEAHDACGVGPELYVITRFSLRISSNQMLPSFALAT